MKQRFSLREHRRLDRVFQVMEKFRLANPDITAQAIQSFVMVALNNGISIHEICRRTGSGYPTVHRHMLDLGKLSRKGKRGPGLIESRGTARKSYFRFYHLSRKGRNLARRVLAILK